MNRKITGNIRYMIVAFLTFLTAAVLFSGCADQNKGDPESSIHPSKSATQPSTTPNTGAKSTPDPNKGVDFDDFIQTGPSQTHTATSETPPISDNTLQPEPTAVNNTTASNTAISATPQQNTPKPIATQTGGEEQTDWTKPVK